MDSTDLTIGFLRTLTFDGVLTGPEVLSLGRFFEEHPECKQTWPGDVLAPMLESAFDDAVLSEEEMTLLAETISSIEEEWRLKNPPADDSEEAVEVFGVRPALLPVIDARFEIPSREAESCVVVLKEHSCTCIDWEPRKSLSERHPGRCCKHVAHAFTRTGKVFEPWFQALLDDCFTHGRGTNPALHWLLFEFSEKRALVGGGSGAWCTVYAPSEDGYGTFAFNVEQERWSFGATPPSATAIERAIRENFCVS